VELPRVGIVIINYKGKGDTLECLESLRWLSYPNYFTVLVDNNSQDGCVEVVRNNFPEVIVIESRDNLGFTGGNNLGIRSAVEQEAEFIFLLNNDTTVHPALLGWLVSTLILDPKCGIVGPTMNYYDHPEEVWATGGKMDWRGQSTLLTHGEPPDFIVGAGLMVRSDTLGQIGLFDDRFFLYYEESDLCARALDAGWTLHVAPEGVLWHKVSKSTGTDSALTLYYMRRNQLLYLKNRKNRAGLRAAMLDGLRLLAVWTLKRNPKRAALRQALEDFRAGRFGRQDIKN
jgi:GT2 family glycosyltransferase